jgi:CubicO group peptidase (beta-lactamase class C family)
MKKTTAYLLLLSIAWLAPRGSVASPADYERSVEAFLDEHFGRANVGMVVTVVDERGTRTFSVGKFSDDSEARVDANTVFEIGSCTKTFTALVLCDMVRRGHYCGHGRGACRSL